MKLTSLILVLAGAVVVLAVALAATKRLAAAQQARSTDALMDLSNQLDAAGVQLAELRGKTVAMTNQLLAASGMFADATNRLSALSAELASEKSRWNAAQGRVGGLNGQVGGLLSVNAGLGERAMALSNHWASLTGQLDFVQGQLTDSRSNSLFLGAELQQQLAQKAALLSRFNDYDEIRDQFYYLAYGFY